MLQHGMNAKVSHSVFLKALISNLYVISALYKSSIMTASRLPVWILLLLLSTGVFAQQFGGNPPSLKWKQINTDTARIIFPAGLDLQAEQVAAIIHRLSASTLPTIGGHQQKINIVLQNQTIIPNGYVSLAPFRSEFQLTPEQNSFDLGSLPWHKLLASHEYRHVQQFNNFRVGLSGALYYLFGEGGQALANNLALPNWFWEGDAVYQETLVTDQGRGRLPMFFYPYRSLWAGDKGYSWMKLRNGSYRDYVPDHYPLGYMLVAYGRERYGDAFWRDVTHDAAAFHGLFYPLQKAVRKYSGVSFGRFRRDALEHFGKAGGSVIVPDLYARAHRHFVANEEFPHYLGAQQLVFMRTSYKKIPAFTVRNLDKGIDTRLATRAISIDNYFSYNAGRIVYAAYETDPRWSWRDYSVIRILDPATGEDRRITSRSRYFSPDLSPDGTQVVAVLEGTAGECTLHLLNSRSGAVERKLANPEGYFYTYPKYVNGHTIVSAVRNSEGQMSLVLVETGETAGNVPYPGSGVAAARILLPFSFQTIGFPSAGAGSIWFTASREGRDRVYCLSEGQLFAVKLPHGEPSTGQYEFQAETDRYTWNTFTAVGYHLDTAKRGALILERVSFENWSHTLPVQGIDSLNSGGSARLIDRIASVNYPVQKYPSSFHLINFHSWRPFINDPDYTFSLASENILNTLESEVFVTYNRNEGYKQVGADAVYAALYPLIDAGWNYTFDRNALYHNQKAFWNESEARAGMSVPLNFTRGKTYTNLQFGSDLVYNQRHYTGQFKDSFNSRSFAYVDPFFSFAHQSQQAQQQIYPRFAQVVNVSYSSAITDVKAHQFLASGSLYLPGLAYTHSVLLGAAFQQRDTFTNARFSNGFPFSRGYAAENFYRMWRLSANYQLPLFYPDWGVGNIVYFLRVRANLYFDYSKVMDFFASGLPYNGQFRSYGSEIYFDTKWWNQLPISFGIRYSRLMDPDFEGRGPNQWELILPLNILSQGYSSGRGGHQ
jgi:hypothetical protein